MFAPTYLPLTHVVLLTIGENTASLPVSYDSSPDSSRVTNGLSARKKSSNLARSSSARLGSLPPRAPYSM